MKLTPENLPERVLNAVNFPVLENILHQFRTPHATGRFVLTTTPMHRHVRLEFRGTGEWEGVLLRSPLFSEDLILQPWSVARLIDQAVAFLVTVAEHASGESPSESCVEEKFASALA
ncbi:MAG: hypothetical protein EOP84_15045 [Verrucomicrobiaceae bacterium]|nr:MAG: hypothetical protein EOP84_15045 [Verrucomicrobiaceae bacterium]